MATSTAPTPRSRRRGPDVPFADHYREWLRSMLLIRHFEEKVGEAYSLGQIGGFCHLYIGQEAVAVGTMAALRPDDYVVSAYREHGQALARGVPARSVMAELFGKAAGCSGGKGGSMHLFDMSRHFMGGHGIVGGQIPLGAGFAFAAKYRQTVARARAGDGPSLLEVRTFRYVGHSMSDAASGTYRTKEELDLSRLRDPIVLLETRMRDLGLLDDAQFGALEAEVLAEVADALQFAHDTPEPEPGELWTDVYAPEAG